MSLCLLRVPVVPVYPRLVLARVHVCVRVCVCVYAYDTDVRRYGWTGRLDREGGSCPDREMRIVSVYELSGVGEQIAQSN